MEKPENFKIDKGLASFGISDHYAILGLPLSTDAAHIRKKFLKLAKILHPDIFGRTDEEKDIATKYFSKMVSPAYQLLNNDRDRGEYLATLRMFAKKQKGTALALSSEIAQKLYRLPHEITYTQFVEQIAPKQYETLESILEYTATLSELNLVYLITQSSLSFTTGSSTASATPISSQPSQAVAQNGNQNGSVQPSTAPKPAQSPALRNLNIAELFIGKKQWTDALRELIAAEKLDPNNAKVYGLKGLVQMNQNAAAIAKSSFQKALKIDPQEPTALKYINQVSAAQKQTPAKAPEKKGGLFGWGKK
ncbi:MAG: DnaJ domain-containing protein [Pseudanabaena sp.]